VHYFPSLPWILLATIAVKLWLGRFMRYLGSKLRSHTILAAARHYSIEAAISFTVVLGLVFGMLLDLPVIDGIIGLAVAFWILYLGIHHAREALIPLLGEAPSRELVEEVRALAKDVDGVEDVHEVILHDYGSKYMVSLHAEIPESYGPMQMHEIAELVEDELRSAYGGEAVCHTDPLIEKDEFVMGVERQFASITEQIGEIIEYHDFRVIAKSPDRIILIADINVSEEVPEADYPRIQRSLEETVQQRIENVAYSSFYITPKFAY
jgi:divalent metal cation (Fe/Co/Zn/Cd) transporter